MASTIPGTQGLIAAGIVPGTHTAIPGQASVIDSSSYTAAYTYAADGLRLRVQESNAQYPDRWMQYDGVRPVLEGTLSGDTYTTTAKYVWEGNSYYSPLVYSMLAGAWRYHLYDGLGSTRQLLQHLSPYAVTDTYSYEAFGNLLSSTGTTPNLARSRPPVGGRDRHGGAAGPHLAMYRYVGSLGYYATGSSLMHLGARYSRSYAPELGRFIQRDPLSPKSRLLHAYVYAENRPVFWRDPSGAVIPGAVGCGIGAVGGIVSGIINHAGFWGSACRGAADCAIGWAAEILVEGSGGAAASCAYGAAAAGASVIADKLCPGGKPTCPSEEQRDRICTVVDVAAGMLYGCVGGIGTLEKIRRKIDDVIDTAVLQALGVACRH